MRSLCQGKDGEVMASKEVLIIGGGIAGMQAALDLGETGDSGSPGGEEPQHRR